jgi:hypothetical protein
LAQVFIEFCGEQLAGGRDELWAQFQDRLKAAFGEVQTAAPVCGANQVFWLVERGSEDRPRKGWVLPALESSDKFFSWKSAFESEEEATPKTITELRPAEAELEASGGSASWQIRKPGRVRAKLLNAAPQKIDLAAPPEQQTIKSWRDEMEKVGRNAFLALCKKVSETQVDYAVDALRRIFEQLLLSQSGDRVTDLIGIDRLLGQGPGLFSAVDQANENFWLIHFTDKGRELWLVLPKMKAAGYLCYAQDKGDVFIVEPVGADKAQSLRASQVGDIFPGQMQPAKALSDARETYTVAKKGRIVLR